MSDPAQFPILGGVNQYARRVRTFTDFRGQRLGSTVIVSARWGKRGPGARGEVLDRAIRLAHEAGRLENFRCGDRLVS